MSDPFSFGQQQPSARSRGHTQPPAGGPPDWNSWNQMPPTGSMGSMGGPSISHQQQSQPAPQPQPAWGSFNQPAQPGGGFQQPGQPMGGFAQMGAPGQPFNPAALAEMANNPMAQLGMKYGREIVQTSLQRYMPGASGFWNSMRYYFHINNSYVKHKLRKLLFPFTSRNFVRILAAEAGLTSGGMQQGLGGPLGGMGGDVAGPAMAGVSPYAAPVHDENAPDLYIPLMAFITFVLMSGLLSGTRSAFTPDVLVNATSSSLVATLLEAIALKAGLYIVSAPEGASMLDLVCYAGYKYVALCVNACAGMFGGYTAGWVAFLYTSLATAYFMINTLMPLVRPENYRAAHSSTGNLPGGVGRMAAAHKNYFVLAAGGLQFLVIWWLSRAIGAVGALPTAVTVAAKSVAGA